MHDAEADPPRCAGRRDRHWSVPATILTGCPYARRTHLFEMLILEGAQAGPADYARMVNDHETGCYRHRQLADFREPYRQVSAGHP